MGVGGVFVCWIVCVSVFIDAFSEFVFLVCFWFVVFVGMGVWWMPWYQVPMKDVTVDDSPGELASEC